MRIGTYTSSTLILSPPKGCVLISSLLYRLVTHDHSSTPSYICCRQRQSLAWSLVDMRRPTERRGEPWQYGSRKTTSISTSKKLKNRTLRRHLPATDDQAVALHGSHRRRCINVWLWSNNCKVLLSSHWSETRLYKCSPTSLHNYYSSCYFLW